MSRGCCFECNDDKLCREGLEKMERGKQKEADRIREAKERDEKQRQIRLAESKVISLNRAANIEPADAQLLLKSKFVCIDFLHLFLLTFEILF